MVWNSIKNERKKLNIYICISMYSYQRAYLSSFYNIYSRCSATTYFNFLHTSNIYSWINIICKWRLYHMGSSSRKILIIIRTILVLHLIKVLWNVTAFSHICLCKCTQDFTWVNNMEFSLHSVTFLFNVFR